MLIDTIRNDMNNALRAGEAEKRLTLSTLLGALQLKEKELLRPLTEAEENSVLLKEIKQTKETIDMANGREDIIALAQERLAILEPYAPKMMTESQIRATINKILYNYPLEALRVNKGKLMKELQPIVKGKADGKLVNYVVDLMLK